MKGIYINKTGLSDYQNIIKYDIKRRYKKAKKSEVDYVKVQNKAIADFELECKYLSVLYDKLGHSNVELMNLRLDYINAYFERAKKKKDLSYRNIIDKLYKKRVFWNFFVGLWIERDILFSCQKLEEVVIISTGEKILYYAEHPETGFIELKDKVDLQFFYEAYHRRTLKTIGYECLKFIDKYIENLEKNEQKKMVSTIQRIIKKDSNKD